MRKAILIAILGAFIWGCASYIDYFMEKPAPEVDYNPNLGGFTKTSILRKFGKPDSKEVSFKYDRRIDNWHYYYKVGKNMHITFINGYVSSVSYD